MRGRVFQRAKGRGRPWSFVVDLPLSGEGKRRQRLKGGFATKAAAEKALAEFLVELDHGMAVDPSRQTLGSYLDDWLTTVSPSLRPTTADLYRRAVNNWITPRIGAVPLQALTPKHLQDLYAELFTRGRVDGSGGLSARGTLGPPGAPPGAGSGCGLAPHRPQPGMQQEPCQRYRSLLHACGPPAGRGTHRGRGRGAVGPERP